MPLWTAEREYETLPLDDYKASRGAFLAASIDSGWQGSPLPSLMRWAERQQMDHGPLGALVRGTAIGMALPGLAREGLEALGAPADAFKPQGKVLSAQEVVDRSKPLGLVLRRGMSEAAFESIATERRRQIANEAVFDRARAGTGTQILGVLAEFAAGAVDPINLASAFLPVSRLGPVARALERVGSRDARLFARGAIEGAAGAVAVEPLVAAAALDENPAYGFSHGLLNVAFGSALGGGLHWLGARITGADRPVEAPTAPQRSAADVLRDTPPEPRAEPASTAPARDTVPASPVAAVEATPQATARAIERMSPEARQTLLDTVVRQAANDLAPDVHALARATGQWVAPPARYPVQPANLGRRWDVDIAALRAEAREFETLRADAARIYGAEAGQRLKAPPDFVPTPAQLKAAKDYVTPPRGKAEPETLAQFVRRQGGVAADDPLAGDLRSQDLGKSGLLRKTKYQGISTSRTAGLPFDDMAMRAYEAGYFPERPTAEQFAAALAGDASGSSKVYSTKADQADLADFATAREARAAFEEFMGRGHAFGDPRDIDPRDLAWWLAHDPTERRLAELDDALARGVISEREALERASLLDAARAADEAAEAQAMLDVIATARRDAEPSGELAQERNFADYEPLTREEFDAVERSIRDAEARGERLPEGDGGPVDARLGEDARAPGARAEPGAAADQGAVPGTVAARAEGNVGAVTLDIPGWIARQADWRADAHIDAPAAQRAESVIAAREAMTPEKDLAELEAAASKLLTDADKAELKLAEEPYKEATALSDAYAQCKIGGGRGE